MNTVNTLIGTAPIGEMKNDTATVWGDVVQHVDENGEKVGGTEFGGGGTVLGSFTVLIIIL